MDLPGQTRSYFYRRLAGSMREAVQQYRDMGYSDHLTLDEHQELEEYREEGQEQMMVVKVNLQEALNRARLCPVCGEVLSIYPDYPQERSCGGGCGDLTVTDVYGNGDVVFAFKMFGQEKGQDDHNNQPRDDA